MANWWKAGKGKEGQKVNSFWTSGLETNFAKDQLSKSSIAKKTSCLRKSSIVKKTRCQKTRCLSVKSRFINYITRKIGRKIGNPDRSMIIDVIFLVKSNYYPNNFCNFSSYKVLKKTNLYWFHAFLSTDCQIRQIPSFFFLTLNWICRFGNIFPNQYFASIFSIFLKRVFQSAYLLLKLSMDININPKISAL